MANEVLANEVLASLPDVALSEADYRAFCNALEASARGRAFLAEFARRNRHANTEVLLAALDRLETLVRSQAATSEADRIRQELRALLGALHAAQAAIDESSGVIKATKLAAMLGFVQHRIESIVSNGPPPLPAEVAALVMGDETNDTVRITRLMVVPRADEPELPIPAPEAMAAPTIALVPQPVEPAVIAEVAEELAEPALVAEAPEDVAESAFVAEAIAELAEPVPPVIEAPQASADVAPIVSPSEPLVERPQTVADTPQDIAEQAIELAPQMTAIVPQALAGAPAPATRAAWIMPDVNLFETPKVVSPPPAEESSAPLAAGPAPREQEVAFDQPELAETIAPRPLPGPSPQEPATDLAATVARPGRESEQTESAALIEVEWTEFALADFRRAAPNSPLIRTKDEERDDIATVPLQTPFIPAQAEIQSDNIAAENSSPGSPLARGRTVDAAAAQPQPPDDPLARIMALSEAERIALFT